MAKHILRAKFIDMTGECWWKWTVIMFSHTDGTHTFWFCRCACGTGAIIRRNTLITGNTKSCGCNGNPRNRTHGKSYTREYKIWQHIRKRCEKRNCREYPNYGGRGITVCKRWEDFACFVKDMGPRPSPKHSVDRIDNDGNYEPGNCRWATQAQQLRNTRRSRRITFRGTTKNMVDWAPVVGISKNTLMGRFRYGWSIKRALTEPVNSRRRVYRHRQGG